MSLSNSFFSTITFIMKQVINSGVFFLIILITQFINHSNTARLYSQWLNSVVKFLINHCTDWARADVTSFVRQFDLCRITIKSMNCIHSFSKYATSSLTMDS